MGEDAKYDWLNVNKLVDSSATDLHSVAFNSIDINAGTSLCAAEGTVKGNTFLFDTIPKCTSEVFDIFTTSVVTFTMCVVIFTIIMLSQFITVIWTERKLIARFMDRRGATTSMRSLWVGENGVTAGKWWTLLPFGLGAPVGWVVNTLNRVAGNKSDKATVNRVNNRSWHGIWYLFPGFFQGLGDGMKFLTKEHMVPNKADKLIYELAPFLIISSTVMILGFLPFGSGIYAADPEMSVLFAFAIFGIAPLGVFFAGWSSNNKYSLLGGIRSAAQLTAYEIPLLITILSVCVLSGSLNIIEIIDFQYGSGVWNFFLIPLGSLLFLVTMIAEVERIPFDMPEAEAELVEGWWTEYGGMRWGLLFASEYLRCYAACILMAHFFFGGYHAPFANFIGGLGAFGDAYLAIPGIVWFLRKAWFFFAIFVWGRAAFPRIRPDQILELGWKYLLPLSLINLAFAFILRLYVFDGNSWGPGSGMIIPAAITLISLILFVVLSVDEDPDWEGQRMSHTRTVTPAGTHTIGED